MPVPILTRRSFTLSALAAASCATSAPAGETTLIFGGPIYTGVADAPVEALAMRGNVVAFAGALADAPRATRRIDLAGAAAFPGFVDAHVHLPSVGLRAIQLDLTGTASVADLRQRLAAYAQQHPQGPIIGGGWIETHWPERRFPTRDDIDPVVGDRPAFLSRADGHAAVVNSAMLALAEIGDSTPDPAGGRIERGASRRATGMLIDTAMDAAESKLPPPTRAQQREALAAAARLYASRGWTGVASMSVTLDEADDFEALALAGQLPVKSELYISQAFADGFLARGPSVDGTGLVHRRGLKLFTDGALGSRGAALLQPYSDAPSDGLLVTPPAQLRELMRRARLARAQIADHAIGDRGNRMALDAFAATFADDPAALRAARWRIEHAQVIDPADIPRFGRMGVIASMQPSHAIGDLYFAPARLGDARLAGAYAWRALLDSGAVIAGGSDAPVEKGDPLIEFYAASYRHSLDGFAGPNWRLDQAVSRAEALKIMTAAPAFASFQEDVRGTLEVGKRADVSVFSADLMRAPFPEIPGATPLLTVSEGRITHNAL